MSTEGSRGKIRVNRPSAGQRGARASNAIRVSKRAVRPLVVEFPIDGAEIEGRSVTVRGYANPGDTLVLETGSSEPISCLVGPDGAWSMPDLVLPAGSQTLTVVDRDHAAQRCELSFVVTALRQITIVAPLQGETLEARKLEIIGKASPRLLVCLRIDGTTVTERANERGSFRFRGIELSSSGEQRMKLYYAEDPSNGSADLLVQWPGLDLPSIVDPITRARLEPGADIVRCAKCNSYCYRLTWSRMGRCPRCTETGYVQRSDPSFHTPRAELAQL